MQQPSDRAYPHPKTSFSVLVIMLVFISCYQWLIRGLIFRDKMTTLVSILIVVLILFPMFILVLILHPHYCRLSILMRWAHLHYHHHLQRRDKEIGQALIVILIIVLIIFLIVILFVILFVVLIVILIFRDEMEKRSGRPPQTLAWLWTDRCYLCIIVQIIIRLNVLFLTIKILQPLNWEDDLDLLTGSCCCLWPRLSLVPPHTVSHTHLAHSAHIINLGKKISMQLATMDQEYILPDKSQNSW